MLLGSNLLQNVISKEKNSKTKTNPPAVWWPFVILVNISPKSHGSTYPRQAEDHSCGDHGTKGPRRKLHLPDSLGLEGALAFYVINHLQTSWLKEVITIFFFFWWWFCGLGCRGFIGLVFLIHVILTGPANIWRFHQAGMPVLSGSFTGLHVDVTCWPGVQLEPLISELHFFRTSWASHNRTAGFLEHAESRSSKREQAGLSIFQRQKLKGKYWPGVMLHHVMLVDSHRVILDSRGGNTKLKF